MLYFVTVLDQNFQLAYRVKKNFIYIIKYLKTFNHEIKHKKHFSAVKYVFNFNGFR